MRLTVAAMLCALLLAHCSKGVDPVDIPRLELTAENVISNEVWLRACPPNPPKAEQAGEDGEHARAVGVCGGAGWTADSSQRNAESGQMS